jgi:hypothetical protein
MQSERKKTRKRGETMSHRGDLDHVLHTLRNYHTAVNVTQAGMQQLRTPEQLARLEQRLNVAYAAKVQLEEVLDQFLTDLQAVLQTQQTRLDHARQRREQEGEQLT